MTSFTSNDFPKLNINLYDRASKNFKKLETLKIEDSYICIDKNEQIINLENQSEIEDNTFLFHANMNYKGESDRIIMEINNLLPENVTYQNKEVIDDIDNNLWYIIRSNTNKNIKKNYILTEGDIIKFGNLKFLINKINIVTNIKINDEIKDNEGENTIPYENCNYGAQVFISNEIKKYKLDRFCYSYNLSLCECGQYIHFPCFKNSNDKKIISEEINEDIKKFYLKYFFCEKCKCQYSFSYIIRNENDFLDSFTVERPFDEDYMILESLGTKDKTVYIIKLLEKGVRIGKSDKNDIIINDPSIKDEHALIQYDNTSGNIRINSLCNDDFNTFVLVRNDIELNHKIILLKSGKYSFKLFMDNIYNVQDSDESDDSIMSEEE